MSKIPGHLCGKCSSMILPPPAKGCLCDYDFDWEKYGEDCEKDLECFLASTEEESFDVTVISARGYGTAKLTGDTIHHIQYEKEFNENGDEFYDG